MPGVLGAFRSANGSKLCFVTVAVDSLGYPLETNGRPTTETVVGNFHIGKYSWREKSLLANVTNSATRGYQRMVGTVKGGSGSFSFPIDHNYLPRSFNITAGSELWVRFYKGNTTEYDLIPIVIEETGKDADNAEGVLTAEATFQFIGKPYYDLTEA